MKKLYELSQTQKDVVSEDFLNEAYELMIREEKGLDDYVLDFKPDTEIKSLGLYNPYERNIKVNPELLKQSEDSKEYNKRLIAIHTIKHEIEHARNLQRLYEGRHDIESLIVRYGYISYIKNQGLPLNPFPIDTPYIEGRVKANYAFNPEERLCEIRAAKYIVNLIKNQRRTHDLLMARIQLYSAYIRGYQDNGVYLDAPAYTFLLNMGMFNDYKILKQTVDATKYCCETRLNYGLPLKYDELGKSLLTKVGLQLRR